MSSERVFHQEDKVHVFGLDLIVVMASVVIINITDMYRYQNHERGSSLHNHDSWKDRPPEECQSSITVSLL